MKIILFLFLVLHLLCRKSWGMKRAKIWWMKKFFLLFFKYFMLTSWIFTLHLTLNDYYGIKSFRYHSEYLPIYKAKLISILFLDVRGCIKKSSLGTVWPFSVECSVIFSASFCFFKGHNNLIFLLYIHVIIEKRRHSR